MTYFTDTSTIGHPIANLSNKIKDLVQARQRRRRLRKMLDLDDHLLEDIGVTRAEVHMALDLPLSVNAATELYRMSLERRRQKM